MNSNFKFGRGRRSWPVLIGMSALAVMAVQGVAQNGGSATTRSSATPVVKIKQAPVKHATADSGMAMYATYCASCHGDAARGDGPAAPGLRSKPVDLTLLSKRNNGVFPKDQVQYILTTSERMPNHGAATMPSWNDAFHALDGGHLRTPVACLRVYNLLNYLEKVQAPGR